MIKISDIKNLTDKELENAIEDLKDPEEKLLDKWATRRALEMERINREKLLSLGDK